MKYLVLSISLLSTFIGFLLIVIGVNKYNNTDVLYVGEVQKASAGMEYYALGFVSFIFAILFLYGFLYIKKSQNLI